MMITRSVVLMGAVITSVALALSSEPVRAGGCNAPVFGSARLTAGDSVRTLAMGDLDGDGHLDLVATNGSSNGVSVLLGDGAGGFGGPVNFAAGDGPGCLTTGDFDDDGDLDLAVTNRSSDDVSILLGDGAGSFTGPASLPVGEEPLSVATGDLDGDGALDIVVVNRQSDDVSVYLNRCGTCPADLDGSGSVGGLDVLELIVTWGTDPGRPPDLDGDGNVGIVDFLELLASWGPCGS